jgi:hypothetical protein
MKFTITNPVDLTELELEAEPEDYNGDQGWRIISPGKDSFVMVEEDGQWNVADESDINPALVDAIAQELKSQTRYI